jgi:HK97 family phage prohead protease
MKQLEWKDGGFRGELGHALDLDLKDLTEQGEFEGYAATFNNVDQGGDVCVPGCFSESLSKRPAAKVKMLMYHDTRRPVGVWTSMQEDSRGLKVSGKLLLTTQDGREAYELLRAGAIDAMSIGYRTLEDQIDRTTGVRKLLKVDLPEVSLVTFPMNDKATVNGVKRLPDLSNEDLRDLEASFRDGGLSRSDAVKAISGFKTWLQRDAGGADDAQRDAAKSADTETLLALRRLAAAFAA